jgi:hypothetical protein
MITALHSLRTAQLRSVPPQKGYSGFPVMTDQVCDDRDRLQGERPPDHGTGTETGHNWADRSRMIAVIPETISGRYLPTIPADSEVRSSD